MRCRRPSIIHYVNGPGPHVWMRRLRGGYSRDTISFALRVRRRHIYIYADVWNIVVSCSKTARSYYEPRQLLRDTTIDDIIDSNLQSSSIGNRKIPRALYRKLTGETGYFLRKTASDRKTGNKCGSGKKGKKLQRESNHE